jgi:DNA-directed RNA polymerase specialized sigma24 family protein
MSFWSSLVVSQSMASESGDRAALLASPELQAALRRFVRARAPASEVDDLVQATLTDALASNSAPDEKTELERWIYGVAKNKVADHFRRNSRETPGEPPPGEEAVAESAPHSARELLRWAERELPKGDGAENTLEWMLREGAGEKLEEIAAEHDLPAPRVRQRVSRLRRHFRERWAVAVAAVAVVGLILLCILALVVRLREPPPIAREPAPERSPVDQAYEIRREALGACDKNEWPRCIEGLDRARSLDPLGDQAEPVQRAREAADRALGRAPAPTSTDSSQPAPISSEPVESSQSEKKAKEVTKKKLAKPAPNKLELKLEQKLKVEQPAPKELELGKPAPQQVSPKAPPPAQDPKQRDYKDLGQKK